MKMPRPVRGWSACAVMTRRPAIALASMLPIEATEQAQQLRLGTQPPGATSRHRCGKQSAVRPQTTGRGPARA